MTVSDRCRCKPPLAGYLVKLCPHCLDRAREDKRRCCPECGKPMPVRGFCSDVCAATFEAERPYWEALEAGGDRQASAALLPAGSPTRRFLERFGIPIQRRH